MTLGSFFGGVASGLESAERTRLKSRQLGLQEQGLVDARKSKLTSDVNARIGAMTNFAGGAIDSFEGDPTMPENILMNALATVESGGEAAPYTAVADAGNGRRALGKYQILNTNIDPNEPNNWVREVLGRDMTEEEFLANETAQEQVARAKFAQMVEKHGDPAMAALEWFTGPDLSLTQTDDFGTSGEAYMERFRKAVVMQGGRTPNGIADRSIAEINKLVADAAKAGIYVDPSDSIAMIKMKAAGFTSKYKKAMDEARRKGAAAAIQAQTHEQVLRKGDTPADEAGILAGTRVKPTAPLVTIDQTQESAFNKEMGKFFGQDMGTMVTGARTSTQRIGQLNRMNKAIDDMIATGAETGPGAPLSTAGRRAAMTWNRFAPEDAQIDVKDISNEELIVALGNQMALLMRNPDSGFGLTGNTSQRDLEFLIASVPGLQTTVAGNKLLIDFMTRDAQRNVDMAKAAAKYVEENGKLDVNFYLQMEEELANNPLITQDDIESAQAIVAREGKAVPQGGRALDAAKAAGVPANAGLSEAEWNALSPEEQQKMIELLNK